MTVPNLRDGGLSFVVPAFNEEQTVEHLVQSCQATGDCLIETGDISDYELVIINDGSTDSTGAICDELAREDRRLVVVHHSCNRTLGAALRSGFAMSKGRWVLYTDADLPFDLAELEGMLRHARRHDADVVAGFRLNRAGEGARRSVYSFIYNRLIRLRFAVEARDVNFAAKLLRREVLGNIELRSNGSFIDAELLIRSERAGFRTVEFGLEYFPRTKGISTLSSPAVIRLMLAEMIRLTPELKGVDGSPTSSVARPTGVA